MTAQSIAMSIRADFKTGNFSQLALSRKYGIHRHTIKSILARSSDKYSRTSNPNNRRILKYYDFIRELLKKNEMHATTIHRILIKKGAKIGLTEVTKAVKEIKRELDISAIRYETTPGQQAQADWAELPGYTVNINGKQEKLHVFLLILGYSRQKYVQFVPSESLPMLISCIQYAFEYYGGYPKEILFDNMPQVVQRIMIDKETPERRIVPEMQNFANYYGFDIKLCRVRRPQEKGKVERFVKDVKDQIVPLLPSRTNLDLDEINQIAINWCNEINSEVHDTTKEIPFDRLPNEHLRPLPSTTYTSYKPVKVSREGYVYHRGVKTQIDNLYACCEGTIVEKHNTVFLNIDETSIVLGHLLSPKRERVELIYKPQKRKKTNVFISTYQNNYDVFN